MKTQRILSAVAIYALALFGLAACGGTDHNEEKLKPQTPITVSVIVAQPSQSALQSNSFPATIQALQQTMLSTRVMGTILEMNVEEGQMVKKGQVIARIASSDLSATKAKINAGITEAEVALANIKKDFDRITNLYSTGSATKKELDDITAAFEMTKAKVAQAKQAGNEIDVQAGYATVICPFDGTIGKKMASAGGIANPGMPLVSIESNSGFKVVAQVSESEINKIKVETPTTVWIPAIEKAAVLQFVSASPNAVSGGTQYEAFFHFKNPVEGLKAGMYAKVNAETNKADDAIWLPSNVLVQRGGLTGVFVISEGNEALLRWVKTGKVLNDKVHIVSGVNKGDKVVTNAQGPLSDGIPVKTI